MAARRYLALALLVAPFTLLAETRVITIGGDVTEIAFALGAGGEVVARDSTSLKPADQVLRLPDVGYLRQLNAEGILALRPSLVLVSELAKPSLALKQVADSGVQVITVPEETSLSAIDRKIQTVATALDRTSQGERLIARLHDDLQAIPAGTLPVKVLFILSHSGMSAMAAGKDTAADAAIRAAGLQNAMQSFSRYQPLSSEGIIASAPDLVVVTADGVKTLGGEEKVWQLPGLAMTPAGKHHRLVVLDDMALLGFGLDTPAAIVKLRAAARP
ncbi:hemin ABC transporter periplasmic component [Sodalis glossinidius str. 'morsitans']|uniref:Hemin ABC transporter periplasmic component n=1 Tax=Sodalis glossinidius (strain morsitans) TaxID=343509 RepID=Q2NSR2_SODGM|nr:hemin ABC transporter periplasmic component [Sodalis glossinidius str. 'morsitans']